MQIRKDTDAEAERRAEARPPARSLRAASHASSVNAVPDVRQDVLQTFFGNAHGAVRSKDGTAAGSLSSVRHGSAKSGDEQPLGRVQGCTGDDGGASHTAQGKEESLHGEASITRLESARICLPWLNASRRSGRQLWFWYRRRRQGKGRTSARTAIDPRSARGWARAVRPLWARLCG